MGNVVFRVTLRVLQPSLPTEEVAIGLWFCELVSQDSFEHRVQWSLTETSHCARAEAARLSIVYMVLLLLFCLQIANLLVLGISKQESSFLWTSLNRVEENISAGTLEKCQCKLLADNWKIPLFYSVNIGPGTSSAKIRKY